jgi:hypothetical protein
MNGSGDREGELGHVSFIEMLSTAPPIYAVVLCIDVMLIVGDKIYIHIDELDRRCLLVAVLVS